MKIENIERANTLRKKVDELGASIRRVHLLGGKSRVAFTFGIHDIRVKENTRLSRELIATMYDHFVEDVEDIVNEMIDLGLDVDHKTPMVPLAMLGEETDRLWSVEKLLSQEGRDTILNIQRDEEGNKVTS